MSLAAGLIGVAVALLLTAVNVVWLRRKSEQELRLCAGLAGRAPNSKNGIGLLGLSHSGRSVNGSASRFALEVGSRRGAPRAQRARGGRSDRPVPASSMWIVMHEPWPESRPRRSALCADSCTVKTRRAHKSRFRVGSRRPI